MERISHWAEKGQGLVEYALILAFVVILAAVFANSDELAARVAEVANALAGLLA